mmetsp:Transcript_24179/g.61499  ORF Transcript_24179/g.61499 Transcript_24179/m.61499 type:complete len:306 (+) Transcript_24179:4099-5016(+)
MDAAGASRGLRQGSMLCRVLAEGACSENTCLEGDETSSECLGSRCACLWRCGWCPACPWPCCWVASADLAASRLARPGSFMLLPTLPSAPFRAPSILARPELALASLPLALGDTACTSAAAPVISAAAGADSGGLLKGGVCPRPRGDLAAGGSWLSASVPAGAVTRTGGAARGAAPAKGSCSSTLAAAAAAVAAGAPLLGHGAGVAAGGVTSGLSAAHRPAAAAAAAAGAALLVAMGCSMGVTAGAGTAVCRGCCWLCCCCCWAASCMAAAARGPTSQVFALQAATMAGGGDGARTAGAPPPCST